MGAKKSGGLLQPSYNLCRPRSNNFEFFTDFFVQLKR